jgi:hypothetical protein
MDLVQFRRCSSTIIAHVQGGASRIAIDEAVAVAERGHRRSRSSAQLGTRRPRARGLARPNDLPRTAATQRCWPPGPRVALQGLWNTMAGRRTQRDSRATRSGREHHRAPARLHEVADHEPVARRASARAFPVVVQRCTITSRNLPHRQSLRLRQGSSRASCGPCRFQCITNQLRQAPLRTQDSTAFVRSALQRWPGMMPSGVDHFIGLSQQVGGVDPSVPRRIGANLPAAQHHRSRMSCPRSDIRCRAARWSSPAGSIPRRASGSCSRPRIASANRAGIHRRRAAARSHRSIGAAPRHRLADL